MKYGMIENQEEIGTFVKDVEQHIIVVGNVKKWHGIDMGTKIIVSF